MAGAMAVVGMAILIYRRRTVGPVFSATTVMDKVMYACLAAVIFLGMEAAETRRPWRHRICGSGVGRWSDRVWTVRCV